MDYGRNAVLHCCAPFIVDLAHSLSSMSWVCPKASSRCGMLETPLQWGILTRCQSHLSWFSLTRGSSGSCCLCLQPYYSKTRDQRWEWERRLAGKSRTSNSTLSSRRQIGLASAYRQPLPQSVCPSPTPFDSWIWSRDPSIPPHEVRLTSRPGESNSPLTNEVTIEPLLDDSRQEHHICLPRSTT